MVSAYGNAVRFAAQNQVVAINWRRARRAERGHVLALLRDSGGCSPNKTDETNPELRPPGERNGLMIVSVFRARLRALVLQITDGVKVGRPFRCQPP